MVMIQFHTNLTYLAPAAYQYVWLWFSPIQIWHT